MSVQFDGNGVSFTRSGLTLNPKKITLPGYTNEKIEVSNLTNSSAKTFVLAALKEYGDLILNLEFDASVYGGTMSAGNALTTITFPDSAGTISFWCDVTEVGTVEFDNNAQPVFDCTLCVTNRNGSGVETVPVYSA